MEIRELLAESTYHNLTPIIRDDDKEMKLTTQVFSLTNSSQVTTVGIIERFSSWDQLKRFVS
jgi:hypothetical protein